MKIAFLIGHNDKSKGFYSPHLKVSEWGLYNSISCELEKIGDVFKHDSSINSYTRRCVEVSKRIGDDYDLVIALHFNSYNILVEGTEVFYWHTNKETEGIATYASKKYSEAVGSSNRGSKAYNSVGENGAGEVYYPKVGSILFEPFFGDNKEDCDKWNQEEFLGVLRGIKNGDWK